MKPLRIDWTFSSPLIVSDFAPVHLDALLAYAMVADAENNEEEDPFSFQEKLPLKKQDKTWKASQLLFVRNQSPFLISMVRSYEGMSMMTDFDVYYTQKSFPKSACNQGSGKYKAYTFTQRACWMKSATAWCIGNKKKVQDLLEQVPYIGKLTRNGFGKVASLTIVEDNRAYENWAIRVLPAPTDCKSAGIDYVDIQSPLTPPYWDKLKMTSAIKPIFCEPEVVANLVNNEIV